MSFWIAMLDRRRENLALDYLQKIANYEVYLPRVREGRNGHHRIVPLFPCYLFVRCAEHGWWQLRWSPGMTKVIMANDAPAVLSDQIVNELKARENRHGLVELPKSRRLDGGPSRFKSGDTVRVRAGVFSGFQGLVQDLKPHQRIEILLAALGRIELPQAAVELV